MCVLNVRIDNVSTPNKLRRSGGENEFGNLPNVLYWLERPTPHPALGITLRDTFPPRKGVVVGALRFKQLVAPGPIIYMITHLEWF